MAYGIWQKTNTIRSTATTTTNSAAIAEGHTIVACCLDAGCWLLASYTEHGNSFLLLLSVVFLGQ